MCFSWNGTNLEVKLVQFGISFHAFFTCNWLFCFTFRLLKYFRKAFSARGQLKKTFLLERRSQSTLLPQQSGKYFQNVSISNLYHTANNIYLLVERNDLIQLNVENNVGPFGGPFFGDFFFFLIKKNPQTPKPTRKIPHPPFRYSQEEFNQMCWKLCCNDLAWSSCLTNPKTLNKNSPDSPEHFENIAFVDKQRLIHCNILWISYIRPICVLV